MRAPICVLLSGLLALSIPAPARAQEVSNPDLYAKSVKAAQQALEQFGRLDDTAALTRVADIGYRIAWESGFTRFPITFHLVDMPEPNAFALPGGQVFVTRGMLTRDLSDDMLAGLLGHEIAHVALQHGLRMQRRANLLNVLTQALVVGVAIGASRDRDPRTYDPFGRDARNADTGSEVLEGAAATGVVVAELLLRNYSREFEDEADEEGQRWAAGAGFDPAGTRELMSELAARLPEAQEYGYWRTHPFFEQRVVAARGREDFLKAQEPEPPDDFRQRTQKVVLEAAGGRRFDPPSSELLEEAALAAWPVGQDAERLRLGTLHRERDAVLARPLLSRDYGRLLASYGDQVEQVTSLTPDSTLLGTLEAELTGFRERLAEVYPAAVEVFRGGVFETEFLEVFLSNHPSTPEAPEVALALGDAYQRLGRHSDAVARYLEAWSHAPSSDAGRRAKEGLRTLAPSLSSLGALQQLASQTEDAELQRLAGERLATQVKEFTDLANGAEYLKRFPEGAFTGAVTERLNGLAEGLLGEVLLYQAVGDHVKALERIHLILAHAPFSPAADRLREQAVVQG